MLLGPKRDPKSQRWSPDGATAVSPQTGSHWSDMQSRYQIARSGLRDVRRELVWIRHAARFWRRRRIVKHFPRRRKRWHCPQLHNDRRYMQHWWGTRLLNKWRNLFAYRDTAGVRHQILRRRRHSARGQSVGALHRPTDSQPRPPIQRRHGARLLTVAVVSTRRKHPESTASVPSRFTQSGLVIQWNIPLQRLTPTRDQISPRSLRR